MEKEKSLIEWINTFSFDRKCNSLNDLSDGEILVDILVKVSIFLKHFALPNYSKIIIIKKKKKHRRRKRRFLRPISINQNLKEIQERI